jgi:hypothetical protein
VGDFGYRCVRYTCHPKKETVLIWLILIAGLAAVVVEAWNDRFGETKKGKIKDAAYLAIATSCLCLLAWLLDRTHPLKVIALVLGVRVLAFDYLVQYLLIKNKVIFGKWWSYSGKTAKWDRLTGRVHWGIRLGLRVVIIARAVVYYTIG